MNSEIPLVSVLAISYNHEAFICQCIDSILDQTYPKIELLVIDNSEKPDCYSRISNHDRKDLFTSVKQENIGTVKTLNKYIPQLHGEYICFISGDDYLPKESIEKRLSYMKENPEFPMCYGRVIQVNSEGKEIGRNNNIKFKSGYQFKDIVRNKFHPPAMTYFYRKDIFVEVGLYDENIFYIEDKYMLYKIASRHPIGFIDDFVAYQRIHENNLTRTIDFEKQLTEGVYIINRFNQLSDFRNIKRWDNLANFAFYVQHSPENAKHLMIKAMPLFFTKQFLKSLIVLIRYKIKPKT